jgi:AmmeMemoRadiSam system protein B
MSAVRPPAVAGLFYPGQPAALRSVLHELLDGAPATRDVDRSLKALIVPHAGYVYSGPVAAAAYARLRAARHRIRRVVLLGPTHRVAVRGVAIPDVDAFATPLGDVPLDRAMLAAVAHLPDVVVSEAAHAGEHSLEVQLPFLQAVLDEFVLVPLAVGNIGDAALAALLDDVWGDEETLILVSSDLSHYNAYRVATDIDRATVARILDLSGGLTHEQACGATPINATLNVARRANLQPRLLAMCNSGDTAGDRARVVGYCAVTFERDADEHH